MDTMTTEPVAAAVPAARALEMLRSRLGIERPGDDAPLPHGPWDPVIRDLARHHAFGPHPEPWREAFGPFPEPWRRALGFGPGPQPWAVYREVFGPLPDPWREAVVAAITRQHPEAWDVVGGWGSLGDAVALNPQPLPPRWAFMAAVAEAAALRAELIADLGAATGGEGGASRYIAMLVDDICGNDIRFRWPFPGPRPHWLHAPVGAADLVVMAGVLGAAAQKVGDGALRQGLADAAGRLAETAAARLS
jgi:hypothetical protein